MIPLDAVTGVMSGVITSGLLYAGTRYTTRSSREASQSQTALESRRVSISEFETFKTAYNDQIRDLENRYDQQETKMSRFEYLLKLALQHIRDLRIDMRTHNVYPTKVTPRELETLLWALETDNLDAVRDPASGPSGE